MSTTAAEHYNNNCNPDGSWSGINEVAGHSLRDACYTFDPTMNEPSDAALDDFDPGYEAYLADEVAQSEYESEMLANADYDEGYRHGLVASADVYTIYAPKGAVFTLTVTG